MRLPNKIPPAPDSSAARKLATFTHLELGDLLEAHRLWCDIEGISDRRLQKELKEKILYQLERF